MRKLMLTLALTFAAAGAQAGCINTVKDLINQTNSTQKKNISLLTTKSQFLKPGEDSLAYGGEYFNNTKSEVEVFFIKESNGYYNNFSALLLDARSCTVVAHQSLGDDA